MAKVLVKTNWWSGRQHVEASDVLKTKGAQKHLDDIADIKPRRRKLEAPVEEPAKSGNGKGRG
ncbi:MAG: hypothetical protein M3547_00975 [Acidobacteriota bacterium]|nr:hypothetical protein [Acidobacteriota bacterium]